MAEADEVFSADSQLASALRSGLDDISSKQKINFTKYKRTILPADGFVFWVNTNLLSRDTDNCIEATGSLHYLTDTEQEEVLTYSVNRVVFTSESSVRDLNAVDSDTLYIGTFDGVRFAFSSRGPFYRQAKLYHYVGRAIFSDLASQIIDTPQDLANKSLVVSNSLPIWLALNNYVAAAYEQFSNPGITLYPSFLVAENVVPPFASVHISPEATRTLQEAPYLDDTLTHWQLCADRVRITLYGLRNDQAQTFVDLINQYSLNSGLFGLMSSPVVRDEKRGQTELNVIAIKKTIEFDVDYYQSAVRNVSRQLVETAVASFLFSDVPIPINA